MCVSKRAEDINTVTVLLHLPFKLSGRVMEMVEEGGEGFFAGRDGGLLCFHRRKPGGSLHLLVEGKPRQKDGVSCSGKAGSSRCCCSN